MKTIAKDFIMLKKLFIQINESKIQEKTMTNQKVQIGANFIYSSDSNNARVKIDTLKDVNLRDLPIGVELALYDDMTGNIPTLEGLRITMKREYDSRVVIGSVECSDYHHASDDDVNNLSCYDLIDDFLSRIAYKFAA